MQNFREFCIISSSALITTFRSTYHAGFRDTVASFQGPGGLVGFTLRAQLISLKGASKGLADCISRKGHAGVNGWVQMASLW